MLERSRGRLPNRFARRGEQCPAQLNLIVSPVLGGFTRVATRYYSYRWHFVAASALVLLFLIAIFFAIPRAIAAVAPWVGPALAASWGMALLCFWFEPARGGLFSGAVVRFIPRMGQTILRWYAAIFLVIWFAFGMLVWPVFVLLI